MMAREKRVKANIKRRPPGLVITPPALRPVAADHPARLLFKEAIDSAKAAPNSETIGIESPVEEARVESSAHVPNVTATNKVTQAESLQIFKELKTQPGAENTSSMPPATALRHEHSIAFEEHFSQWRPFLTEAQMCVLEALYNMTHAQGSDNCLTSMPKLAAAAGISERQTYNVVKELEKCGFVERPDTYNTPTKKGTVFRLYLSRQTFPAGVDRRYHYGD